MKTNLCLSAMAMGVVTVLFVTANRSAQGTLFTYQGRLHHGGADDKHVAAIDADGVALAAIQGLNQKVDEEVKRRREKGTEIQASKVELATTKQALRKITQQKE